ncbi:succinyl-diaminopimelate desuccinylase [Candidatus Tisiphia endosymbiont of Oplodontha viridula]|uniref:succinyl-diaminopimelate desuccinylase n=1 Tax=Candidatus Tisiphia endosymbiont of Oplodontha viridula TaxID=3077925 RepID=UPI0035C8F1FE
MYINILEKLISFQSVTPKSSGCIEYISNLLEENGFKTETKIFGEDDYKVTNLYAVYGTARPNICFAGHVDVVPAGDRTLWSNDPFIASTVGDKIYGRGAVDMKGAIACFLAASLQFIKYIQAPNGSISFLITSDEEGSGKYGTVEMLKHLHRGGNNLIDLAIVGEPTNEHQVGDTVKIGRRGSINFNLALYGMAGHVAYPLQANNPIPCLIQVLNELVNYRLDEGSEFFQQSNLEITSIDVGNDITNVIPGRVTTKFNVRFNDLHSSSSITDLIDQIVNKYCTKYQFKYELSSVASADCFIQKPTGLIADFVQVVSDTTQISTKLSTSGGTSDARFIKNYCPVVEFGLLFDTAHKINEYTKISDLQSLHHVYYDCLTKFLAETS